MFRVQIPDVKTGNDRVEAVVIDEESVGSVDKPGCGEKILRGDGALDDYLAKTKCKEQEAHYSLHKLDACHIVLRCASGTRCLSYIGSHQ
ncbi:putative Clp protease, ATP-binding subunit ClpX [Helianthus annuus]|uniref:Clp protease, ATP-binding subunit ClpX n=1 Tax=Helianthus annuus TaxID=4232 RepID=A0A251TV72_HELAN|nr:putative Clp protease, ATP-binding subunit ClpX [Helianthus annuus]KAJ0893029.1 putative Clp protease, ATP-binding subunit ClpX [Helianthus annuus]